MNDERESYQEQLKQGLTLDPYGPTRNGKPSTTPETNGTHKRPQKRHGGRFEVLNQFVDESAKSLSTTDQAVWLVLYRETKSNGTASVSHQQIADKTGVSRRTAIRSVAELVKAGLAEVVNRGSSEGNTPSTYRVYGRPQRR